MRFELTAKGFMCPGGQIGDTYIVNVNLPGLHQSTVLSNSKATDMIRQQLSFQGLDLPPHGYLSYGQWDVKQIK